jgi:two-component system response regulator PhoP
MKVLVVEDEKRLATQLQHDIQHQGYSVDIALNGREAQYLLSEYPYDLALIDLGLPDLDGMSVIRWLRGQVQSEVCNTLMPILVLTARGSWQDKVEALEAGADDYVVKPFQMEEIIARLNALLRRSKGHASPNIVAGPLTLNTIEKSLSRDNELVELTSYEYRIIEYLMLNPRATVSKTELVEHIYEQDYDRDSNVIEVLIGRLRKKLDPDNQLKPIRTLRGQGYRFELEIQA